MKVASILKAKGATVETVPPDTTLSTAVWALRSKGIGALVVSEDGTTILGLVSERDIVHGLAEHGAKLLGMRVSQVMTGSVVTCTPEDTIQSVMARMTRHRARHIPVVEDGKLRGIVSIGDVVKQRLDALELEANVLRETMIVRH
ncbi:MAG: CBS domain-containing protein [Candidatus Rokubacteria bacterium]|nr:CBS domain-containing protein [Candidatus Rokubacteria bacterium]